MKKFAIVFILLSAITFADNLNELYLFREINNKHLNLSNIQFQCKFKSDNFDVQKEKLKQTLKDKNYIDSIQLVLEKKNNEFTFSEIKGEKETMVPYFALDMIINTERKMMENLLKMIKDIIFAPRLEEYLLTGEHKWENNIFYYYYSYKNEKSINKYIFTEDWALKEINISSEADKNKNVRIQFAYEIGFHNLFIPIKYSVSRSTENAEMNFDLAYNEINGNIFPVKIYSNIIQNGKSMENTFYLYDFKF